MRFIPKQFYFPALFLFLCIITYQCTTIAHTSKHYVDKNASGQNNGTSWANAWESFSAINWGSIKPGDIIYVSGGTDSTVYNERLNVQTSGTAGNWITIRNSYEARHNGRVIIDGNNSINDLILIGSSSYQPYYIYVKGFEVRRSSADAVRVIYAVHNITLDSLVIYDNAGGCIMVTGDGNGQGSELLPTGRIENLTIKNCYAETNTHAGGLRADVVYVQGAYHTIIDHNFLRVRDTDQQWHNDPLQGLYTEGWRITNNYFIGDSSAAVMGNILGACDNPNDGADSVIWYNNFWYVLGNWVPGANDGTVFTLRWYNVSGYGFPPAVAIHNTVVSCGPNYTALGIEYPLNYAANNIFAAYGNGVGDYKNLLSNASGTTLPVNIFDTNLYYREWGGIGYYGSFGGNVTSGTPSSWTSWTNTYGGNGINVDPDFVYDMSNSRQADLESYTVDDFRNGLTPTIAPNLNANSPAINHGKNIQTLIESMGLEWVDIEGNPRDSSPDIGAYEYAK